MLTMSLQMIVSTFHCVICDGSGILSCNLKDCYNCEGTGLSEERFNILGQLRQKSEELKTIFEENGGEVFITTYDPGSDDEKRATFHILYYSDKTGVVKTKETKFSNTVFQREIQKALKIMGK